MSSPRRACVGLVAICAGAACSRGATATEHTVTADRRDDGGEPLRLRPPEPGERATMVQLHMADHYADLRLMERALVDGELADARAYATALALDRSTPELEPWAAHLARMRTAAMALASAEDVAGACRLEPMVAATCGACHAATGAQLPFADDGPLDDDGTTPARMARHQWAADRLWQALIAPSSTAWRDGLTVFAATPLPADELAPDADADTRARMGALARRLADTAATARPLEDLDARAAAYGELLVTCAGCHTLAR